MSRFRRQNNDEEELQKKTFNVPLTNPADRARLNVVAIKVVAGLFALLWVVFFLPRVVFPRRPP
jgi:hypothetical protein